VLIEAPTGKSQDGPLSKLFAPAATGSFDELSNAQEFVQAGAKKRT